MMELDLIGCQAVIHPIIVVTRKVSGVKSKSKIQHPTEYTAGYIIDIFASRVCGIGYGVYLAELQSVSTLFRYVPDSLL